MPAANALITAPTERGRAAVFDRPKRFELCPGQRAAISFDESVSCPADDIGHLPRVAVSCLIVLRSLARKALATNRDLIERVRRGMQVALRTAP
jgi:hypothetical protein